MALLRPPEHDRARPFPVGTGDFDLIIGTSILLLM